MNFNQWDFDKKKYIKKHQKNSVCQLLEKNIFGW